MRRRPRVQKHLRRTIYDKIAALGPGAVARRRSGALALSLIDGCGTARGLFRSVPAAIPGLAAGAVADLRRHRLDRSAGRPGDDDRGSGRALRAGPLAQARFPEIGRARGGLQFLRRRVPGFGAGPRHLEGLRPERCPGQEPGAEGAGAVPPHHVGARVERALPRHHRQRHRLWRRGGVGARRLACGRRVDADGGVADDPAARRRAVPPDARAPLGAAPGHGRHWRRRRASSGSSPTNPWWPMRCRRPAPSRWCPASLSRMCSSATPVPPASCIKASISRSRSASGSAWSGRRAAASPRSCGCCCASTIRNRGLSGSAGKNSAVSPSIRSARWWRWSARIPSCSTARWKTISGWGARKRRSARSRRRRRPPISTASSRASRRAIRPPSARRA